MCMYNVNVTINNVNLDNKIETNLNVRIKPIITCNKHFLHSYKN